MPRRVISRLPALAAGAAFGLALAGCSPDPTDASAPTAGFGESDLSQLARLEATTQHAEAVRAIKRVQRAWAQYLGAGRFADAAALFGRNAAVVLPDTVYAGADGIRRYFTERFGVEPGNAGLAFGELNEQLLLSPVVNLDPSGTRAEGRWRLVALEGRFGESARWQGGIFENTYVLEDGAWKIAELRFFPLYAGDYADGWRNLKQETQAEVEPVPFHYDADGAGMPWPPLNAATLPAADPATAAASLSALEARVGRLLDEQAVLNLQNAFGYYIDRMLWTDAAELFAADGTIEIDLHGIYRGRPRVLQALQAMSPSPLPADRSPLRADWSPLRADLINDHLQLQPVVMLAADAQSARIRGTELRMLGQQGGDARWGIAIFENRFRKSGEARWEIESMHVTTRLLTDYDTGWAASALPPPGANAARDSDAPPSVDYAAYPEFYAPPFGFTGREFGLSLDPEAATSPTSAGSAAGAASSAAGATGSVSTAERLGELERRLRQLEAYDGAENVANAYGYYIDEFLWDGMADLFAVNGWKELSYIGTYVGRERVRQSVVSRYGRGGRRANSMTFHQKVQPVITVADDGMSAKIRTRLFQLNSSTQAPGSFISGIYENQIVNEDGIWKILGMDLDYQWTANYTPGWHRVEAGASQRFAPAPGSLSGDDAPDLPLRGVSFAPYPDAPLDMAFHYANPVSGRAPPLLLDDAVYAELAAP
jgi:hypothetical protein